MPHGQPNADRQQDQPQRKTAADGDPHPLRCLGCMMLPHHDPLLAADRWVAGRAHAQQIFHGNAGQVLRRLFERCGQRVFSIGAGGRSLAGVGGVFASWRRAFRGSLIHGAVGHRIGAELRPWGGLHRGRTDGSRVAATGGGPPAAAGVAVVCRWPRPHARPAVPPITRWGPIPTRDRKRATSPAARHCAPPASRPRPPPLPTPIGSGPPASWPSSACRFRSGPPARPAAWRGCRAAAASDGPSGAAATCRRETADSPSTDNTAYSPGCRCRPARPRRGCRRACSGGR